MTGRHSAPIMGLFIAMGLFLLAGAADAGAADAGVLRAVAISKAQMRLQNVAALQDARSGVGGPRYQEPALTGPRRYHGPRLYRAPGRTYRGIRRYRAPVHDYRAPVAPYSYDSWDRGYDRCVWIRRQARRTGKAYWWRHYRRCARYYFH